jgi:hypothetical protein
VTNQELVSLLSNLDTVISDLCACPLRPRREHSPIPKQPGLYVFHDSIGQPIYVGQARNLNQRLAQHTRPSSGRNSASFAFLWAYHQKFSVFYSNEPLSQRKARIEEWFDYEDCFRQAKDDVSKMNVRFLVMDGPRWGSDPFEQGLVRTIMEVFVANYFETSDFNSFETH